MDRFLGGRSVPLFWRVNFAIPTVALRNIFEGMKYFVIPTPYRSSLAVTLDVVLAELPSTVIVGLEMALLIKSKERIKFCSSEMTPPILKSN